MVLYATAVVAAVPERALTAVLRAQQHVVYTRLGVWAGLHAQG